MNKTRKKLGTVAMVLALSSLACTSIYFFAIDEDLCKAMGGRWNQWEQECIEPLHGNTATEDTNSEPADENASEPVDENVSDPVDETVSDPTSEISIEDCVAKPDEYAREFAHVNNAGSNDTKAVCQGDFYMQNTSNRVLHFKWFEYWDNGAMQDIGWMALCQRLEPGEEFSLPFGTQTFSTGDISESVATFTKLIVFYDLPGCAGFLLNEANETLWDKFAIPLSDPCR
jgi:hypothetical protein